jgi:membrane glycosyltransferase
VSEPGHIAAAARLSPPVTETRHFTVPAGHLVQDWKTAYERAVVYLKGLGLEGRECEPLASEAVERALQHEPWGEGSDAIAETFHALQTLLPERYPVVPKPWHEALDAFTAWRLEAQLSGHFVAGGASMPPNARHYPLRDGVFSSMPRLTHHAMVPDKIERRFRHRLLNRLRGKPSRALRRRALRRHRRRLPWTRVARRRRLLLSVLVLIPSVIASGFMVSVLPQQASTWLEFAIVIFFGALFGWISIGFWTALLGFFTLIRRRRRFAITNLDPADSGEFHPDGRTAIVMPICDEPVGRVFAGLRAIYASLARTGALAHFDFFILSDSGDPGTWVNEEEAWAEWCRAVNGFGTIFYRRRRVRLERKSGNVADFCRRWGHQYHYMIMLDADSIMAGDTLVRLVRMMERHQDAGMIQTAPTAVNRRSLFARVQQFAARVYGPMFAAGLHYWQLGDGQYWGHNAIIRLAPFMHHCGLPRLPGKPPLGGEILSHDFVEAALMGRAGWTLWLAFDLPGSYEEVPSTLLEEMKRDRRWCQGNLQHLRLLFTEGLFGAHRALFLNGALSYVSALLWFAFLTLSTAEAIQNALREPEYFPHGRSLFPEWPVVWHPHWALYLAAVTAMILFLPKLLSIALIVFKGRNTKAYGGVLKLSLSVFLEILLSSLLAPIRMVFHSRFVVQNLLGRTVQWGSQEREDAETRWWEAIRRHGFDSVFASAWAISLYWLNPHYFWWVTPIIVALILSVPISALASRVRLGERTRARGLFLLPEESTPPPELLDLREYLRMTQETDERLPEMEHDGFVRAAVDAYVNALHRALLRRQRRLNPSIRAQRERLVERGLVEGPAALSARERKILLADPDMIVALHERVWTLADRARALRWGRPGTHS